MSEIKRELTEVDNFLGDSPVYIIDENHTLKDILRHVLRESGDSEEFLYLAKEVYDEAD